MKKTGKHRRNDGDHKLVGVPEDRNVSDLCGLSEGERGDLHRLYPREDAGEGWFGRERAEEIMGAFFEEHDTVPCE